MIAKNIKGKSFGGCVRYVMNEGCELLEAEGVFVENTQTIIRSFAMQRANRSEIKQPVGHIPVSFAPEDKGRMTNDFMLQLAKEYMQEMGIGNTQYIIVRHHNTDNDHLHIVYNRIDNDLKLISVNHDYDRNVKVCKKLKDKHNLTYGENKDRVKREKLRAPDKVKYEIYDAIKAVLPTCIGYASLAVRLEDEGVSLRYKYRRDTEIIEGISFEKDGIAFKASDIDRKFSHANLVKAFEDNAKREIMGLSEQPKSEPKPEKKLLETPIKPAPQPTMQPPAQTKPTPESRASESPKPQPQQPSVPPMPQMSEATKQPEQAIKTPLTSSVQRRLSIRGGEITAEQWEKLQSGGHIFVENMDMKDGSDGKFSSYVFLDDEKKKVFYCFDDPDKFVKYGKYEMRLRDKMQVEQGIITKAKVKWWGGGFAHPYLWKPGAVKDETAEMLAGYKLEDNSEYCLSWGDPRKPELKVEQKPKQIKIPTNKKGIKR